MDNNNRLLNLPVELFLKITKNLTIFDLQNLESSGLFELNENGVSATIQAAFEQLSEINIKYEDYKEEVITKLVLRCGTGLKSFIVKCKGLWTEGFLSTLHWTDENFIKSLATRCPNIERFAATDYKECEFGANEKGIVHYVRNIDVSKLIEVDPTYLPIDVLPSLFNSNLKSLTFLRLGRFLGSMDALNESHPNFGSNIRQLVTSKMCLSEAFECGSCSSSAVKKLLSFFPNLETIQVKTDGVYARCNYKREQIYKQNFFHQLELLAEYTMEYLPFINMEQSENFDLSSIVKAEPHIDRFDPAVYDQLENLHGLLLKGNKMMFDFSDYLSDASFKSLKRIDFTGLTLDIADLPKFEKIVSTKRFVVNSIVASFSLNVHKVLIPLLVRFCRNIRTVDIELEPENIENYEQLTVTLAAEELKLLNSVGVRDVSCKRSNHWKHKKPYKCIVLRKTA